MRALSGMLAWPLSRPPALPANLMVEGGWRMGPKSSSRARAELRPVQRSQFALDVPFVAMDCEEAPGERDRVLQRRGFQDREAADHLLGLREGAVDDGHLSVVG